MATNGSSFKCKSLTFAAFAAALAAACADIPSLSPQERGVTAQAMISGWSEPSRIAAAKLIEEYGPPDVLAPDELAWNDKGPWKRTMVRDAAAHQGPASGDDIVEQTIVYELPDAKFNAVLRDFNDKITVTEDPAQLTARNAGEELNFLTLNLANEIVNGRMEPLEARRFYWRTLDLAASGKSSNLMQGLLFKP